MKRDKKTLQKKRHNLIYKGLLYIDLGLTDEWITFSLINTRDWDSYDVINKSVDMMSRLEAGYSYKEAKEDSDRELSKLSKAGEDFVDKTLDFFYKPGARTKTDSYKLYELEKKL